MKKILITSILFSFSLISQEYFHFKDGRVYEGKMSINSASPARVRIEAAKNVIDFFDLIALEKITSTDGEIVYPVEFVTNEMSKRLHLPDFDHSPKRAENKVYNNRQLAVDDGYALCNICFDSSPNIPNYNLEMDLSNRISINMNNNYDILYEHPQRGYLQILVEKIVDTWIDEPLGYKYRVQVVRDRAPNAIAVPAGNIYVTTGLLDIIESEDELIAVLTHEVAHIEKRHGLKQLMQSQVDQNKVLKTTLLLGVAIAAAGGSEESIALATSIGAALGTLAVQIAQSGYSKELEEEADIIAQTYFKKLKKDEYQSGMVSILDKLHLSAIIKDPLGAQVNAYSSHPSIKNRIEQSKSHFIHFFDEPITIELNNKKKNKKLEEPLELKIHTIFGGIDQNDPARKTIQLFGAIKNPHPLYDMSLNLLLIDFIQDNGNIYPQLMDVSDHIFVHNTTTAVNFKASMTKQAYEKNLQAILNKKISVKRLELSAKHYDLRYGSIFVGGMKNVDGEAFIR